MCAADTSLRFDTWLTKVAIKRNVVRPENKVGPDNQVGPDNKIWPGDGARLPIDIFPSGYSLLPIALLPIACCLSHR